MGFMVSRRRAERKRRFALCNGMMQFETQKSRALVLSTPPGEECRSRTGGIGEALFRIVLVDIPSSTVANVENANLCRVLVDRKDHAVLGRVPVEEKLVEEFRPPKAILGCQWTAFRMNFECVEIPAQRTEPLTALFGSLFFEVVES